MILLSLFVAAAAEPPPEGAPPKATVKVSGLLFPQWELDLSEGAAGENAFTLTRTYLRAEARINEHVGARVTLDSRRGEPVEVALPDGGSITVPADERYSVYVKHAWIEWKPTEEVTVRGGIVDTPLIPSLEAWQGRRWVHKTFFDDTDLGSSADVGVNVAGRHAAGLVSWCAGVYNGETYKAAETGAGKSVQARLTVDPLAPRGPDAVLPISLFVGENVQDEGVPAILTWAGDAGFKDPNLFVAAEVAGSVQGEVSGLGESVQGSVGTPRLGYLFARLDHWDPDLASTADDHVTLIVGPAHDFYEKVSLGAFYERTTFPAADAAPEQLVTLHAQVGF